MLETQVAMAIMVRLLGQTNAAVPGRQSPRVGPARLRVEQDHTTCPTMDLIIKSAVNVPAAPLDLSRLLVRLVRVAAAGRLVRHNTKLGQTPRPVQLA